MSGTNGGEGQVPASEGPGSYEPAGPPGLAVARAFYLNSVPASASADAAAAAFDILWGSITGSG